MVAGSLRVGWGVGCAYNADELLNNSTATALAIRVSARTVFTGMGVRREFGGG